MGAAVFFGCTFIAFGPAFALFLLTVAVDPLRVIILVAGAFFWLVSLLLASLIWFISVHLSDPEDSKLQYGLLVFGAAVSVLLQEAFRFAYFKLLKKADEGLAMISEDGRSPISLKQMAYAASHPPQSPHPECLEHSTALNLLSFSAWQIHLLMTDLEKLQEVSGLSFGIISGVFSVINILADSIGPGIIGIHGDSPYYFITSAFLTMAVVFLHTFWGVIFFDACEKRRFWSLGLVVASHLITSGLTFLNPWYEASLVPIYIITVSMGIWAFFTAGGSLRTILLCLPCKEEENSRVMVYSALQVPVED
ncbi:gamma-secretase subunit APH-1A isoform X2 [Alligator mississippiensis]|uniref:gamma-secretase subunit APH-1A isoform X2 n=1 Tax=Alligator mississippiensis TaxID=8496 RepID=UPI0028779FB0|nr:gamma-secretase subunit APH-1A isoform X2 [Alligator mississippiensis]